MADDTQSKQVFPISDPNHEPVRFVSMVGNSGFINGIFNVTFLTSRHFQNEFEGDSQPQLIVAALLRMDLACVLDLHARLGQVIADNTETPRAS